MALSKQQCDYVHQVITTCVRNKFKRYKPESKHMPFHFHLLGKDRMLLFSFIQSLNTSFGKSIFEPVAVAVAKNRFKQASAQYAVGTSISGGCQKVIQAIMNDLTIGHDPDKTKEFLKLKASATQGKLKSLKTVKVDLFLESHDGSIYLFDIKTAKPNKSNFKDFKRTLLEWVGIALTANPKISVNSLIAIPYNPYAPKPYERWTMKGMFDIPHELKVAEEFWDFLGGKGAYNDILNCFENAGKELRSEIDDYFSRFKSK